MACGPGTLASLGGPLCPTLWGKLTKWTEDCYGFSHFGLQKYLTAEWLRYDLHWVDVIGSPKCGDPWWEHVIYLCIAGMIDGTEAIKTILKNSSISKEHHLWIAANTIKFDPII